MPTKDKISAIIGAAIGITLAGMFLVYLPMKANYGECGKVTLCRPEREQEGHG